jgi:transcriptional regulator with XRE-family HTH domain
MTTTNNTSSSGTAPASSRAYARGALPAVGDRQSGRPSLVERAQLAATVGAVLRAARLDRGWGTRRLATAIGCARSTVQRLEAGQLRPRECTLRYLASVLHVEDPRPLADRLVAAAGPLLRPDTDGAIRQRQRRANAALLAGRMPLPAELDRRIRAHRAASAAWHRAQMLVDRGDLNDLAVLDEIDRCLTESRRLRAEAGSPITIRCGRRELRFGVGE